MYNQLQKERKPWMASLTHSGLLLNCEELLGFLPPFFFTEIGFFGWIFAFTVLRNQTRAFPMLAK